MYLADDFYGDSSSSFDDTMDQIEGMEEWWDYNYGSKFFDNNNIFEAEQFDYGDALGMQMHENDAMNWDNVECLNCERSAFSAARETANLYQVDNIEDEEDNWEEDAEAIAF